MQLFIKLLVFSFPLVFASALLWPHLFGELPALPSADVSRPTLEPSVAESGPGSAAPAIAGPERSRSRIYQWRDEQGRLVFSDSPDHATAVAYTPVEIGHYEVSADIKQREWQARVARLQAVASGATAATTAAQKTKAAGYGFSSVSAGQKHKYVLLSGRISSGPACKQLRVVVSAGNGRGGKVRGVEELSYNGFGSSLFEMKLKSN